MLLRDFRYLPVLDGFEDAAGPAHECKPSRRAFPGWKFLPRFPANNQQQSRSGEDKNVLVTSHDALIPDKDNPQTSRSIIVDFPAQEFLPYPASISEDDPRVYRGSIAVLMRKRRHHS